MSKNRNYHNYSNNYNKPNKPAEVAPEVTMEAAKPVVEEELVEVVEEVKTEVKPEPQPEPEAPVKEVTGTVVDCEQLNVRVAPVAGATPVTVINKGTLVVIDEACSTEDWFKVYTEAGVEGYCMKQYIKLNK